MSVWILILVMINPMAPHIITIPVEEFPTKDSCFAELNELMEAAMEVNGPFTINGKATLICLRGNSPGDNDNSFTPENLNVVRVALNQIKERDETTINRI